MANHQTKIESITVFIYNSLCIEEPLLHPLTLQIVIFLTLFQKVLVYLYTVLFELLCE